MTKKQTEKQKRFIDEFVKKATNIKRTCEAIGINRATFYRWYDSDNSNTFRDAIDDAKEGLFDDVESKLYSHIKEGNVPVLIHFSKTKMRERGYGDHTTVENIGAMPVSVVKRKVKKVVRDSD